MTRTIHSTFCSYAASVGATHFSTSAKQNKGIQELFLDLSKSKLQLLLFINEMAGKEIVCLEYHLRACKMTLWRIFYMAFSHFLVSKLFGDFLACPWHLSFLACPCKCFFLHYSQFKSFENCIRNCPETEI